MKMYLHLIKASEVGDEQGEEFIYFPTTQFTKEQALSYFKPVQQEITKNGERYIYTAYEFNNKLYSEINYWGEIGKREGDALVHYDEEKS